MPAIRIHERFLRHIWNRQLLRSAALHTADGRSVVVEHPGILNRDSGPDVRRARIRIGETLFTGDVEIHRTVGEWLLHRHHGDPAYNSVILHVVLKRPMPDERAVTRSGRELPMLILGDFLADTLRVVWQEAILEERASRRAAIRCYAENTSVPMSVLEPWLDHVAAERLEVKMRRFEERLRDLALRRKMTVRELPHTWGDPPDEDSPDTIPPHIPELTRPDLSHRELWDQVLYEGILECLGYSKNRMPFIRLSQHLTLEFFLAIEADTVQTEALLFGVAGLLPRGEEAMDHDATAYAAMLRSSWEALSGHYRGERLSSSDWVLSPTRPANAPVVRLVAARDIVRKILRLDLFRSLIVRLSDRVEPLEARAALHRLLEPEPGPFWDRRVSFQRTIQRRISPLGTARRDEIIVNTVMPLGLLYARIFRRPAVREGVVRLLEWYPANAPNTLTARMERQLLRGRIPAATAQRQQALVQLYKYYCEDERCRECAIGQWLWGERGPI
ncbi:MAG: DUF2851 family protein, partial [Bacteroidota bacterium]